MTGKVYVEGGGNTRALKSKCREGFREFFLKAGLKGRMPRIVASGPRKDAYDDFCTTLEQNKSSTFIMLLVDSEAEVAHGDSAWEHLKKRDNWEKPKSVEDDNAHLMVQCMEAWFIADRDALKNYFGQKLNLNALPVRTDIENIMKPDLEKALKKATRLSSKGEYDKGRHSFDILAGLDPDKVTDCSPYAQRLVDTLRNKF